jgi:hypothetical protein
MEILTVHFCLNICMHHFGTLFDIYYLCLSLQFDKSDLEAYQISACSLFEIANFIYTVFSSTQVYFEAIIPLGSELFICILSITYSAQLVLYLFLL